MNELNVKAVPLKCISLILSIKKQKKKKTGRKRVPQNYLGSSID